MAALSNTTQVDVVEPQHCMLVHASSSRGIWFGENPFDDPYPLMLAQIILVVLTSRLLYFLLRPLGQTKFVCNLLSGIILGSSVLGGSKSFKDRLFAAKVIPLFDTMATVGAIYSMFLVALKFDATRFKRMAKDSVKIGLAMDELNPMTSELGQFAMSSAILNDVIFWFLIALHLILTKQDATCDIESCISVFGLILFTVYVIRPIMLSIVKNIPQGEEAKEVHVVAIQLGVLVMAFISDVLGTTPYAGVVLLGLAIPGGPPLGAAVVHKTEYLVSQILMPMFFFYVGYRINLYSIRDWVRFSILQTIIIVSYVSKIVAVVAAAMWCKIGFKNSLRLSMVMSVKGIIEIVSYSRCRTIKLIDEQAFTQIVLSMLGMTMIATPLLRFSCIYTTMVHAVELMGRAAPLLVPYNKLKHTNTPMHQMIQAFENYSDNSEGPVTIHAYDMIAPYKNMHDTIIRLAHDKVVPLIILPFHDHQGTVDLTLIASIRQFNINVQTNSPCTVGILVDRDLSSRLRLTSFSFNVAVIFIGGADDREALAYAARISGNPTVGMTVFRIILRGKLEGGNQEEEIEAKLDQSLVDEFKLGNIGNDCVNWYDIEVDDGAQVMSAIKKLQGDYDLIMVGRRHVEMSLRDEEMAVFMEHPELGVIGDMLSSSDFCDGMVNVLVMQESRGLGCGAFRSDSARVS
ncbi:cation/H(+) antiporter 15-like [Prunus avium]|uniref:Cation/H(+) antiporter 15-like n=1 Tax=Prunus avium TaxID=42229 RepID=A0A6P5T135_PRUAV|nr:cation/H(+) antiporter 15-like [Prunus avium]